MATKAIVGEKVGMTQVWDDDNRVIPVTVLRVAPARVVQVKTTERDGYVAVQVTYGRKDARKLTKPEAGHFAKAGVEPGTNLVELRLDDVDGFTVGQEITAGTLTKGERVDVTAVSRGKGWTGAMKRHNFSGQGASHGNHKMHRSPGSIGACSFPGRVFKGTKMAGRSGGQQVTTLNLEVVSADPERNLVLVKGAIPGPRGGVVIVRNAVKGRELMATVTVKTTGGAERGSVQLADDVFGIQPNVAVMHQVVTAQLAKRRAGTQSTKTRAEVRGGGKKPFRQKGTGNARQGSTRAPHWSGGGVALGPKPRSYAQRTPKKMIRLALHSALSDRAGEGKVLVVEAWSFDGPKTRDAKAALAALGVTGKVLVVVDRDDDNAILSFRNLPEIQVLEVAELNAYDVLCNEWIVFTKATLPGATVDGTETDAPDAVGAVEPTTDSAAAESSEPADTAETEDQS